MRKRRTARSASRQASGRELQSSEARLGPGLITGAADDDPSGIITYSQAGAQFGYQMGWTVVLTYPLMVAIQLISAQIGRVSGRGLAENIARHFPPLAYPVVALLLIANTFNIAADIGAMAECLRLILGGSAVVYALGFGLVCLALQIWLSYRQYVRYLKWLTLTLFAYVAVVFTVNVPWREVLLGVVWPRISFTSQMLTVIVAVLGTTISPYLFFWQAVQEAEDVRTDPNARPLRQRRAGARRQLGRIELDTYVGMAFSNLVALFVMISAAAALHSTGAKEIGTAAEAAQALQPLAGDFAVLLFTLGIIGTGLLAVPVLAGSAAYAVAAILHWRRGLDLKLHQARGFYLIVGLATVGGSVLDVVKLDPIKALFWAAVINGVVAVPVMVTMLLLAAKRSVMGKFAITRRLQVGGWLATTAMACAVAAMLIA
jgi:Mn2+/Fe2+ NRAMP family transporter